jgi:hypothetical protein
MQLWRRISFEGLCKRSESWSLVRFLSLLIISTMTVVSIKKNRQFATTLRDGGGRMIMLYPKDVFSGNPRDASS